MKALTRLAYAALLLCLGTALVTFVAYTTMPGYFSVLRLHTWAGWLLLASGIPALGYHLWKTGTKPWVTLAVALVVATLALPSIFSLHAPDDFSLIGYLGSELGRLGGGDLRATATLLGPAALAILTGLALLSMTAGFLARSQGWQTSRWTGVGLVVMTLWAALTGAVQSWVARDDLSLVLPLHTGVGLLVSLVLVQHLLAARLRSLEVPRWKASSLTALGVLVTGLVLGGLYAAEHWGGHMKREDVPGIQVARTAATAEERAQSVAQNPNWVHLDPATLKDSSSCGATDCHPDITQEWQGSPHRWSADNRFYKAAVGGLLAEGKTEAALFCANCHDPERALTGQVPAAYSDGVPESGSDGVSCLVCHGMTDAGTTPETKRRGNGLFTLAASLPTYPGTGETFQKNVRLDVRRHELELGVDAFVLDRKLCEACHRIELGPDLGLAGVHILQGQSNGSDDPNAFVTQCELCHLPQINRKFDQYTHEMAGINADLIHYTPGASEADRRLQRRHAIRAQQQAGLVPYGAIDAPDWPQPGPALPPNSGSDLQPSSRSLGFQVSGAYQPSSGQLAVKTTTWNARVGHDFPSGPLDLQEIWMELLVRDSSGTTLSHLGALDERGRVADAAARLGARELTASGEPLPQHRLLELDAVEDKAILANSRPIAPPRSQVLQLDLPEDVQWPLDIRARWLFRRVRPEFAEWALDVETSPIPVWELVGKKVVVGK